MGTSTKKSFLPKHHSQMGPSLAQLRPNWDPTGDQFGLTGAQLRPIWNASWVASRCNTIINADPSDDDLSTAHKGGQLHCKMTHATYRNPTIHHALIKKRPDLPCLICASFPGHKPESKERKWGKDETTRHRPDPC